jgi:hypothetical protein
MDGGMDGEHRVHALGFCVKRRGGEGRCGLEFVLGYI